MVAIEMMSREKIYIAKDQKQSVIEAIMGGQKFLEIAGQLINVSSITGIFDAKELIRREKLAKGEWQCGFGEWHREKEQECKCPLKIFDAEIAEIQRTASELKEKCQVCKGKGKDQNLGWCECVRELAKKAGEIRDQRDKKAQLIDLANNPIR